MNIDETLISAINAAVKKYGGQSSLALKTDVSRQNISRYLNGSIKQLTRETWEKLNPYIMPFLPEGYQIDFEQPVSRGRKKCTTVTVVNNGAFLAHYMPDGDNIDRSLVVADLEKSVTAVSAELWKLVKNNIDGCNILDMLIIISDISRIKDLTLGSGKNTLCIPPNR